jgi:hypothetical protein
MPARSACGRGRRVAGVTPGPALGPWRRRSLDNESSRQCSSMNPPSIPSIPTIPTIPTCSRATSARAEPDVSQAREVVGAEAAARQRLRAIVADVAGTNPHVGPVVLEGIRRRRSAGFPGDTEMLVVGSRGHAHSSAPCWVGERYIGTIATGRWLSCARTVPRTNRSDQCRGSLFIQFPRHTSADYHSPAAPNGQVARRDRVLGTYTRR